MDPISDDDDESYDPTRVDVRFYSIQVYTLESKVLRHTCLIGDVGMRDFIFGRLHTSIISELRLLDSAQRPPNYNQIMVPGDHAVIDGALEGFDRPASWKYRDDEFPQWCGAFEK